MALFSKKNIKSNPFGLTEDDLKGDIKYFPMGVVVRMLEAQEAQGNKPDIKVFQDCASSGEHFRGFDWDETEAGHRFWDAVIEDKYFELFFKRYPEYEQYNLY